MKLSLQYLAGFTDGEGCVTIGYNKTTKSYFPVVTIANTNELIMGIIAKQFGGRYYVRAKFKNRKPVCIWYLSPKESVYKFLKKIHPYSIVKRDQIETVLSLEHIKYSLKKKLKQDIHTLNKTGRV